MSQSSMQADSAKHLHNTVTSSMDSKSAPDPDKTPSTTVAPNERPESEECQAVDECIIKLLKRKATTTLLSKVEALSVQQIFEFLFLSDERHSFDTVCFCRYDPDTREWPIGQSVWIKRQECFFHIYSYVVRRATAISLIEEDGYRIIDDWESLTDEAWVEFVKVFTQPHIEVAQMPRYGRTVMNTNLVVERMFEIFTEKPMKFRVQDMGTGSATIMHAVVTITDKEPRGHFDIKWEYMPRTLAKMLHPDSDYVFDPSRPE